jgi:hypothetical protein
MTLGGVKLWIIESGYPNSVYEYERRAAPMHFGSIRGFLCVEINGYLATV